MLVSNGVPGERYGANAYLDKGRSGRVMGVHKEPFRVFLVSRDLHEERCVGGEEYRDLGEARNVCKACASSGAR